MQWDHSVELLGAKAIIVYPQSLGDPGTGNEAIDGQGDKFRQVRWLAAAAASVGGSANGHRRVNRYADNYRTTASCDDISNDSSIGAELQLQQQCRWSF